MNNEILMPLIVNLGSSDASERAVAAFNLFKEFMLGRDMTAAIPALENAQHDPDEMRIRDPAEFICRVWPAVKDEVSVESRQKAIFDILVRNLSDPDLRIRQNAAHELYRSQLCYVTLPEIIVAALKNSLTDADEKVRIYASCAFLKHLWCGIEPTFNLDIGLSVFQNLWNHPDPQIREITDKALTRAAILCKDLNKYECTPEAATALVPALAKALIYENETGLDVASYGLEGVISNGGDISPAIPALVEWLERENQKEYGNHQPAKVLGLAAEKGTDISSAVHALQKTYDKNKGSSRSYASKALSRHFQNTGKEKIPNAVGMGSMWSIEVFLRPSHGTTNSALTGRLLISCYSCRGKTNACIYDDGGCEEHGGSYCRTLEYQCYDCGKFTVYNFNHHIDNYVEPETSWCYKVAKDLRSEQPDIAATTADEVSALKPIQQESVVLCLINPPEFVKQDANLRASSTTAIALLAERGVSVLAAIDSLATAFQDSDPKVKETALDSIQRLVDLFVQELPSPKVEARRLASAGLWELAINNVFSPSAMRALPKALEDTDPEVVDRTLGALSRCGPKFVEWLSDPNVELRREAAATWLLLAQKGVNMSAAIPHMQKAASDEDEQIRNCMNQILHLQENASAKENLKEQPEDSVKQANTAATESCHCNRYERVRKRSEADPSREFHDGLILIVRKSAGESLCVCRKCLRRWKVEKGRSPEAHQWKWKEITDDRSYDEFFAKKEKKCPCQSLAEKSGNSDANPVSVQNGGAITIIWGPRAIFSEGGDVSYCVCEACLRRWQVVAQQPDHCPDTFYYWYEITGKPEFDATFEGWPPA